MAENSLGQNRNAITLTSSDFYDLVGSFLALPMFIEETEMKKKGSFRTNWLRVFGSEEAAKVQGIVYVWETERPIPRLRGLSRIVYIGQTTKSLKGRHLGCAGKEAGGASNVLKYPHVIENFGKIAIRYRAITGIWNSPREAENQLLWWYFQNHLEYPPFNYTKAGKYSSELSVYSRDL